MTPFCRCLCQRAGTKGEDHYTVYNCVKQYTLIVKKLENLRILIFICAEQAKYKMWECQMWMSSCKNSWHYSKMSVVFATWHQSLTFRIAKNSLFSKNCQMSGIQSQNFTLPCTFFGHGTQKNVKCRLQAYLVTALGCPPFD